jgi:hypothetical protein
MTISVERIHSTSISRIRSNYKKRVRTSAILNAVLNAILNAIRRIRRKRRNRGIHLIYVRSANRMFLFSRLGLITIARSASLMHWNTSSKWF